MKDYHVVSDEFLVGYYQLLDRLVGTLLAQRGNGQPALGIHQLNHDHIHPVTSLRRTIHLSSSARPSGQ
jgi:hypothetical protein